MKTVWRRPPISRTVLILGITSFLTDLSSEMIYPLLPLFLSTVLGAGALQLGIIEGVAESTASLLKVVSGWWTDRAGKRTPFVIAGYSISGLARPLMGLATGWTTVLGLRFTDRIGKGIRTSPRDALIADVTPMPERGQAYGFHRAMDHAGAVMGPLVAVYLLRGLHVPLRSVFLWAAVPAVLVVILLVGALQDPESKEAQTKVPLRLNRSSWSQLGRPFHVYLAVLFFFTLGGSTDAFLLMRLSQLGLSASAVALLWSLHHGVKMASTYWGGFLADRYPSRMLILAGWILYAGVYVGFAWTPTRTVAVLLFLLYGVYYGLTEPAERLLVSQMAEPSVRGTAFGYFHGIQGIAALPASALFGLIWKFHGAPAAFLTGACLSGLACVALAVGLRTSTVTRKG